MKLELSLNEQIIFLNEKLELDITGDIEQDKFYKFEKKGYHIFPLGKGIPLMQKEERLPIAVIKIMSLSNYMLGGTIHTIGEYYTVCTIGKYCTKIIRKNDRK